jgi:hypothetical protein
MNIDKYRSSNERTSWICDAYVDEKREVINNEKLIIKKSLNENLRIFLN